MTRNCERAGGAKFVSPALSVGWETIDAPSPVGAARVLKGHDFSRAEQWQKRFVSGHDFSRAEQWTL